MILDDYTCVLCANSVEESRDNLFLDCPFAFQCWNLLNLQVIPGDAQQTLMALRNQLQVPFFYGHYHSHELGHVNGAQ